MNTRALMIGGALAALLAAAPLAQADPPRHAPAWGQRGHEARDRDHRDGGRDWDDRRGRDHRRDWNDRGWDDHDRDHRGWDHRREWNDHWRGRAYRHGYWEGYRDHRWAPYGWYAPGGYYGGCGDSGFSVWLDGIGASYYESGRYCR